MIIGIFGKLGQGKTLVMTHLLMRYYQMGYDIFSNYALKVPHKKVIFPLEIKDLMVGDNLKVFALDELGGIFRVISSVTGDRPVKVFSAYVFMRSRKKNSVMLYTSQRSVGMALKDLRDVTDFIVIPKRIDTPQGAYIKYSMHEALGLDAKGSFILGDRIERGILKANVIGKYYNTWEDPYLLQDPRWERLVELTMIGAKDKESMKEKRELLQDFLGSKFADEYKKAVKVMRDAKKRKTKVKR